MGKQKSYDDLSLYLGEGVLPILDSTETLDLIRIAQEGIRQAKVLEEKMVTASLSEKEKADILTEIKELFAARNKLAERNSRLVSSIAKRFTDRSPVHNFFDLFQEGFFGLMRAIELFQEGMGTQLVTYASYWIRQNIQRAIISSGRTVSIPAWIIGEMGRYQEITTGRLTGNNAYAKPSIPIEGFYLALDFFCKMVYK